MIAISKVPVRQPSGKILGFIETDKDGNQQVRDFTGYILGYYDKRTDMTRDFVGRPITRGNTVLGLLYEKRR